MEHSNLKTAPTTVTHIPKELYKRFPDNTPGPEMDLIITQEEEIETDKLNTQLEGNNVNNQYNSSRQSEQMESTHMSDTQGSVTNQLRTKHTMSAPMSPTSTQEAKKAKTDTESNANFQLSLPSQPQSMSPETQIRTLIPNITIQKSDNKQTKPNKTTKKLPPIS